MERLINLDRELDIYGLAGTEVIVNRSRTSVEDNLRRLLKYETTSRVAHIFNSNEKNGIGQ